MVAVNGGKLEEYAQCEALKLIIVYVFHDHSKNERYVPWPGVSITSIPGTVMSNFSVAFNFIV